MKLIWGDKDQLKFNCDKEYYFALGVFANPSITSIRWEQNTKTGSYTDAYRLKVHAGGLSKNLPVAIRNALRDGGRINCNSYVLNLIENHGFVLSGNVIVASYENVIGSIPKSEVENILAFIEGYNALNSQSVVSKKVTYQTESIDVSGVSLNISSLPKGSKKDSGNKKCVQGKRDYIKKAIEDFEIGEAGEKIVYNHEKRKLQEAVKQGLIDSLDNKLEWISLTNDSAGYDIRSYDPESKRDMYIEVKTTTGGACRHFYMSELEVKKAKECADDYYIFRLYKMRRNKMDHVDCFVIKGDISTNDLLRLTNNGYIVEIVK